MFIVLWEKYESIWQDIKNKPHTIDRLMFGVPWLDSNGNPLKNTTHWRGLTERQPPAAAIGHSDWEVCIYIYTHVSMCIYIYVYSYTYIMTLDILSMNSYYYY